MKRTYQPSSRASQAQPMVFSFGSALAAVRAVIRARRAKGRHRLAV